MTVIIVKVIIITNDTSNNKNGETRVNTRTNMNSILKKQTKNSLANYISKEASLCYCFIHA